MKLFLGTNLLKRWIIWCLLIFIVMSSAYVGYKLYKRSQIKYADFEPNVAMVKAVEEIVVVTPTPNFEYSYTKMDVGAIQHLDRGYTYDSIPELMRGGYLFQGIHKPPKGTSLKIELFQPMKIFFFFHNAVDGGYSKIFEKLEGWTKSSVAPQYDVDAGNHGRDMTMYIRAAEPGILQIPKTSEDRGCFSIVFKPRSP